MKGNLPERPSLLREIGYILWPYQAGDYFASALEPGTICSECRSLLDYSYVSPNIRLRRKFDIGSVTARHVASERFRAFCLSQRYRGIDFIPLQVRGAFYEMRPRRVLHIDQADSRPDFSDLCPKCGQFQCITIGRGIFLEEADKPLNDGIYRTDLNWACATGKWPLTIIAPITARKIKAAGFKNYYLTPIPYLNEHWRGPRAVTEDRRYHAEHMARARRALKGK